MFQLTLDVLYAAFDAQIFSVSVISLMPWFSLFKVSGFDESLRLLGTATMSEYYVSLFLVRLACRLCKY